MDEDVRITGRQLLVKNWGSLTRYELDQRRRDGTVQPLVREVYDHGSAAAVLLCAPRRGTVILTRQFRFPAHLNGDDGQLIEACAGLLDGDEPDVCARREAEEETGYRPTNLRLAFVAYMSPGSVTEKVWCFLGDYDPDQRIGTGGGLLEEGEDIEVLELDFAAALAMTRSGAITDAKTIMLLQHAALEAVFER